MTLTVANAAGFLGDRIDAAGSLLDAADIDVLTLEYLAELTLSILARAKQSDPSLGYARDFLSVIDSITSHLQERNQLRVVTNAGGMNVRSCAAAVAQQLNDCLPELSIATVEGDDILDRLDSLQAAGHELTNLDSGASLRELQQPIVSANVYMGAEPIVEALSEEARLVITGRVADASLTVGPAWQHYGWRADQFDPLAGATVAGHLIECGAQVTGGYSTQWQDASADIGYPIAEIAADGSAVITKPTGSGGRVDRLSATEQLVYEIGDPQNYLTPDVVADFSSTKLQEVGPDRVAVTGTRGKPAPGTWKVSLAYQAGYRASGQLLVYGRDCVAKADRCRQIIQDRMAASGASPEGFHAELLGCGDGVATTGWRDENPPELVLRMTVCDSDRAVVERFTKEIAPLITAGPAGLAGYAAGRIPIHTVLAYWPTVIPRDCVTPKVTVARVREWTGGGA